jgi:hypothetical protein
VEQQRELDRARTETLREETLGEIRRQRAAAEASSQALQALSCDEEQSPQAPEAPPPRRRAAPVAQVNGPPRSRLYPEIIDPWEHRRRSKPVKQPVATEEPEPPAVRRLPPLPFGSE